MAAKKKATKRTKPKPAAKKKIEPPKAIDKHGRLSVMIEMRGAPGASGAQTMSLASSLFPTLLQIDQKFSPVPMSGGGEGMGDNQTFIIRGTVADASEIEQLRNLPEVAEVWTDTPIEGFAAKQLNMLGVASNGALNPCPIGSCDCDSESPKGDLAQVATYLGVDRIWNAGFRGAGIVVGIVDGGITAVGRSVADTETHRRIPRVIGGWPEDDWGTKTSAWGEHGNMCATDVLGMAPQANLYDLRISGSETVPGTVSRALQAYQWAIDQHRRDGTPQILTNSWGIYQEDWDPRYARNPNHPFTRKVVEAIREGILVLFAAGNCGDTCPSGRCGSDVGAGKSIWGANGHPRVMTVGAVNKDEEFVGYSSRGPAALDADKPDFCSVTHFAGYFDSDSGTSAATPILAGVLALLKQARPDLTQDAAKKLMRETAKDIGPNGFDRHSGAGIVRPHAAFGKIVEKKKAPPKSDVVIWREDRQRPELERFPREGQFLQSLDAEIQEISSRVQLDSDYLQRLIALRQQL